MYENRMMWRVMLFFTTASVFCLQGEGAPIKDGERSIWMYPFSQEIIDKSIATCKSGNLDALVPVTYYGGFLYKTKLMDIGMLQKYTKFELKLTKDFTDPLEYLIGKAKANNLKVYPTFAVVRAPKWWGEQAIINKNPEWSCLPASGKTGNTEWANVHNQEYQDYFCSVIADFTSRYDVDGIDLDYVRVGDEAISFDEKTRDQFKKRFGYDFHLFAKGLTELNEPNITVNFLTCPGIMKRMGIYVTKWIKWCDDLKIGSKKVETPPLDDLETILIVGAAAYLDDSEINSLIAFIEKGGKAIFLEVPTVAMEKSARLRQVLGVENGMFWASSEARIKSATEHFITRDLREEIAIAVSGSSAKKVTTAKVLASFVNTPQGMPGILPAVTLNEYGKGKAILFHWVPVSQIYGFTHDMFRRSVAFLLGRESMVKEATPFGAKSYTDFFNDFQTFNAEALERFLIDIRKSIKNEGTKKHLSAHVGADVNLVTQGQNPPVWIKKGLVDYVRYMNYGGFDHAMERAAFHVSDINDPDKVIEVSKIIGTQDDLALKITKMRGLGISRFEFWYFDPFDTAQDALFKNLGQTVFRD